MSSYYFNEDHQLFRQGLRDFLKKEVTPNIDQWEEQRQIPKEIWKKMGDMGYMGLNMPEEYGGMDADFFFSVIFCEEISKCFSGGFAITPMVIQYMSSPYILKHGSKRLKEKYLAKTISGDCVSCIGISEPGAGSDVANIQTRAIREGDHYVVNGSKTFITNGVYGDIIIAVVKTDPEAGSGGVSLLVIDLDAAGVSARKLKKLGWHASDTAELNFDDVKVPVENLIGEEGQGFYYLMGGLQLERLVGGVAGVAASESALEYALQYMSERTAFGRPINKFQVLRHRVAQLASEIEAAKYFVYHCCQMHNDGHYAVKECSMAKMIATELSDKVMYQCLQFFGGYGYMEEYKIARMFRDSRVGTIGGGSTEIMREIIAKMVIDDTNYQSAAQVAPRPQARAKSMSTPKPEKKEIIENTANMNLENVLELVNEKASGASALGNSIKFNFGEEQIFVDGKGDSNVVTTEDKDADCTVDVSMEDFAALLNGTLNPMQAVMSQKAKIKGDMAVAMKLGSLFG